MEKPYSLAPGAALNYTLQSFSETFMPGEFTLRLALEKYTGENLGYTEITTLYQETHDFSSGGDFQYNSSYTPGTVHPGGRGRDKGLKEWKKNVIL